MRTGKVLSIFSVLALASACLADEELATSARNLAIESQQSTVESLTQTGLDLELLYVGDPETQSIDGLTAAIDLAVLDGLPAHLQAEAELHLLNAIADANAASGHYGLAETNYNEGKGAQDAADVNFLLQQWTSAKNGYDTARFKYGQASDPHLANTTASMASASLHLENGFDVLVQRQIEQEMP